jgi:putative PEP-CTERM system histidine kinase
MTLPQVAFGLATLSSAALGLAVLARRPRGWREVTFALGMAAFVLETVIAWVLLDRIESPDDRVFWLRLLMTSQLLVPLPWGLFVASLLAATRSWRALAILGAAALTTVAMSALTWLGSPFLLSDLSAPFYAARLDTAGLWVVQAQLIGTVAVLAELEFCFRTADRDARWRIKYLLLGLAGAFVVRFYLLSHVLLFHVLLAAYLATQAATLVVANVMMAVSVVRRPLGTAGFTVSRTVVYRSAVVGILGLYLFAVGALGWLLNTLGMSEELFWGSLLVFVAAAAGSVIALSEDARWRLKRFIGLHFYRSKYDYRAQWINFTRRLGSTVTLEGLAPQLLAATTDAIGSAKGILYLSSGTDEGFHLGAALEVFNAPDVLDPGSPLAERARESTAPAVLDDGERPAWFPQATVLVPLMWQGSLTGLMIVAGERTGTPYAAEDLEFLATVGVQLTAAIVTTRLSETVARSREFEAFHRLTSFVIHDLKNAVSSLTLLGQNALQHFDDPEFQRDAITTLSKTADRMRKLLQRFTAAAEIEQLRFEPIDLDRLLREHIAPLARGPRVRLTLDLQPVTAVGDVEALERVFQNLVRNALEALDGGGDLTLRCAMHGDSIVCDIADTGCGMSREFLRHSAFVPFRTTKKGGWGIGLYHAREIVRAHGGRIDVQSEEGRGTTFTVTLPVAAARDKGATG